MKWLMMNSVWKTSLLALCFTLTGCFGSSGPEVGNVRGQVTLDGQPLAEAKITFSPIAEARGSFGTTDANGYYKLEYTFDKAGALVGEHRVSILSGEGEGESAKDPLLPASYNTDTKLTAEVKAGSNTIDFKLTSDGAVPAN